jgi:hypothetical protein
MSNGLPLRWYQFRLGTWFVLTAILAWAMTEWPWVRFPEPVSLPALKYVGRKEILITPWKPPYRERIVNPGLLYPALALAAFVGWKAAWAIAQRRKNLPATH